MPIPTEPIGSIPRPGELVAAFEDRATGRIDADVLGGLIDHAAADTIRHFEAIGSPVLTGGEQGKPSFATYPIARDDGHGPRRRGDPDRRRQRLFAGGIP